MIIGNRLREIRERKQLSHCDIERRTGFDQRDISDIECGHIVASIAMLEHLANSLDVPLYELFYDSPPNLPYLPARCSANDIAWGRKVARSSGEGNINDAYLK